MGDTVGRKKKRDGEDRISRHRCATAGVKEAEKTQRGN